ncbi:MAG: hypothetical protein ACRDLR_01945 [Gaiellaceae bacterium]
MSVYESEWLRPRSARPKGERRFRLLATLAAALFFGDLGATLGGAPDQVSNLVFNFCVFPVPFLAWWAYARASTGLRPTLFCCAWAATLWLAGSLVWYGFFLANGSKVPTPPGWWDIPFAAAQLLLIAAVLAAVRSYDLVRFATLDVSVIAAAGIALGAAFIGKGLESEVSALTLTTLNRPLLGIVTLMLLTSAALGSWEGTPRSLLLLGLGEAGLVIGNLVYSYAAVQGRFDDNRWANLGWAAGAELCVLAASTIILGVDRPVHVAARRRIPGHPAASGAVLLVNLGAIALTLAIAAYGTTNDLHPVALVGVLASVAIAIAMVTRARGSLRRAELSSALLETVLAESERARARLDMDNVKLQQANAGLRTVQLAVTQGFDLIDERTQGRLREIVEESGDALAALVDETLEE